MNRRYTAEFLEEYRWEPADTLLVDEPPGTGDEHWDVFLAALAEHLALRDDRRAPEWAEHRTLRQFWFPFRHPSRPLSTRSCTLLLAFRRRREFSLRPQELSRST